MRRVVQAKNGDTVRVHYTGTLADGTQFDSSTGGAPLEFTLGQGTLIAGFEEAVIGMEAGKSTSVTIPIDAAYGPKQDHLIMKVDKDQLPPDINPELGDRLEMKGEDEQMVVSVTAVTPNSVTLDANHPLAGKTLTFAIELIEILSQRP